MSLSKVDLRYRPQDLKLSVVLDDYRRAINNIVDEVNGLSEDSADTIVASSDVMNSLNPDYFIRSGKIYIKNYYDTTYPISGGGTLSSPRTLSLLYFDTDLGLDADNKLYVKDAGIDHDATTNFVADEHIAHSGVSIAAGTGLTGGGTIASNRTISLSHLGIESLADPGADNLMGWDDVDGAVKFITLGTNLTYTHATHTLSASGGSAHALLSATHDDTTVGTVIRGDIITGQGVTPKWVRLAKGTTGYFLKSDANDVTWAAHGLTYSDVGALAVGGTAVDSDKWDGYQFADYLNQAVLTTNGPTFDHLHITDIVYSDYYVLGAIPASAGRIRIPNNAVIKARNAANDGDVSLIYADTNDRVLLAGGRLAVTTGGNIVIGASAAGSEILDVRGRIALQETTAPLLTAGYGKLYVKLTDSLIYFLDDSGIEYNLTTGGGGAGAPSNAEYIVGATNASLSAEVVKAWLADNYSLDDYPVSPNALDDEFEDSSINVKWTFVNDPGFSESTYPGFIYYANAAELGTDNFDNLIRMYQAPPTGAATMEFIAKVAIGIGGVSAEAGEFACIGIYLGDSANDDMVGSMMQFNNASSTALPFQARGIQADAGTLANMTTDNYILASPCGFYYVKLKKTTTSAYTSANTYEAYFSQNGITWIMSATTSFTFTGLCNEVGIFFRKPKSQAGTITAEYAADFFRKTA